MNLPEHQTLTESLIETLTWLPFLLEGFGLNLLISALAMLMGTLCGAVLAQARLSRPPTLRRAGHLLTELTRNVPTFVFLYYLAFMLPTEIRLPGGGEIWLIPGWVKAALALSIAVTGFCADNLSLALAAWREGDHGRALLIIPSWAGYGLIIVMASSTASVVGVPELLSRCNTVIAATGNTGMMLPVYALACAIFVLTCWPLIQVMDHLKRRMMDRYLRYPLATARGGRP